MSVVLPGGGGVMCGPSVDARHHRRSVKIKKWLLLLAGAGVVAAAFFLVDARTVPDYAPAAVTASRPVPAPAPETVPVQEAVDPARDASDAFAELMAQDDEMIPLAADTMPEPPLAEALLSEPPAAEPEDIPVVAAQTAPSIPEEAQDMAAGAPKMELPRFHGMDAQQRPFNVTADAASWPNKTHATLEAVRADAVLEDGFAEMQADHGSYAVEQRVLELQGNVVLRATRPNNNDNTAEKTGRYAEVRTSEITAELDGKRAYGNRPVTVESDMGTLEANAFGYDATRGVAVFTGGVTLTLNTDALHHTSQAISP